MLRVFIPLNQRCLCNALLLRQSNTTKRFYPHPKKLNRKVRQALRAEQEEDLTKQRETMKVKKENDVAESAESAEAALTELNPPPDYLGYRVDLWQRLIQNQSNEIASKVPESIDITLPDGKVVAGESWRTTPYEVRVSPRLLTTADLAYKRQKEPAYIYLLATRQFVRNGILSIVVYDLSGMGVVVVVYIFTMG